MEMMDDDDYARIVSPFKKVHQWIENVKDATQPHFDDVFAVIFETIAHMKKARQASSAPPGKKFKDKSHSQKEASAGPTVPDELVLSDSDGDQAGKSDAMVFLPKRLRRSG
ncbi:Glutathione S-transferase theta-1 [Dionaea muscipula]